MPASSSPSLFETPDGWLRAPVEAFNAWLVSESFATNARGEPQFLRESSVKVYKAMFNKFASDVLSLQGGQPGKSLVEVSPEDIREFLDRHMLTRGIRHRYVRLLERTYDRLQAMQLLEENPARGLAVRQPTRSGQHNEKTVWLTPEQQKAVLAALPSGGGWKQQRARAMIAVVLEGGLKPSEVLNLRICHVGSRQEDGSVFLDVYPGGAGRHHRTRVGAHAAAILLSWLKTRHALNIHGPLLFPASPAGGALNPATVYRQVRAVLADAGIPEGLIKRRGARTLRNTFAISALQAGEAPALVGEYLGHRADRSTRYYTELLPKKRR